MPGSDPPPAQPRKQNWRHTAPSASVVRKPSVSRRGKKIFALSAVLLALGGAVAAWLLFVKPVQSPYFLTIPVSEYTSADLPANAFAEQDSDALLKHFTENDRGKKAFESQTRDRLLRELRGLEGKSDVPLVVHLRAHALWRDGKVYVLPGDADVDDPSRWLPLGEILQALSQCKSSHKLLILDLTRPLADASLGILTDDVAAHVQDVLEAEPPSFLILCACSRGQVSLVSEEERLSVFGHYLERGLRGHADFQCRRPGDHRPTRSRSPS